MSNYYDEDYIEDDYIYGDSGDEVADTGSPKGTGSETGSVFSKLKPILMSFSSVSGVEGTGGNITKADTNENMGTIGGITKVDTGSIDGLENKSSEGIVGGITKMPTETPKETVEGTKTSEPENKESTSIIDSMFSNIPDNQEEAKTLSLNIGSMNLVVSGEENDSKQGTSSSNSLLSPDEKLSVFADQIVSCCIGEKSIKQYALNRLFTSGNPKLFRNENYILFCVFSYYRSKLKKIKIDKEFLELLLRRNLKFISEAKGFIDVTAYGEIDGSYELGYITGVIKHFVRLSNMPELSEDEFETVLEKYLIEFKSQEASKVYSTANIILTEGMKIGRKFLHGFEDSDSWARKKLAEIEGLCESSKGTGYVKMRDVLASTTITDKKPIKVADFGRLEALNDVYGGIFTSTFYQVLAPPKCGKSKLCARICHTAITKYGTNVTVWAQEGGYNMWTAQMRAIHFDYTYNTGKDITQKKYGVDQKAIMEDKFPNEELKELEQSSKKDLESNMSYGSVDYVDRPFTVETFIDSIDASVKENGSQIVIIDYLQLIGSEGNMSERERVSEAYRTALTYCKDNNIALISPGQYKQEVIDSLLSKNSTSDADMRTSGGSSSEVIRTPDIIFTLWATTQDLSNGTMKILSMPSRMSKPFPEINVVHDLGACQFISVD